MRAPPRSPTALAMERIASLAIAGLAVAVGSAVVSARALSEADRTAYYTRDEEVLGAYKQSPAVGALALTDVVARIDEMSDETHKALRVLFASNAVLSIELCSSAFNAHNAAPVRCARDCDPNDPNTPPYARPMTHRRRRAAADARGPRGGSAAPRQFHGV